MSEMTTLALALLGVDLTSLLGCLVSLSVGGISFFAFFAILEQLLEAILFKAPEFISLRFYVVIGLSSFLDYMGLVYAWQNFFNSCPNIV